MAAIYKVLGQSAPAATTETDLYTVPASTDAVVSTITISNRSSTAAKFRISVAPAGASTDNKHYLAYDLSIGGNDVVALTLGITLDATDKIRVYSSTANLSFNAFGTEIS